MLIDRNIFLEAWIKTNLDKEFAKKLRELYPDLNIEFKLFSSLKKAVASYKKEQIGRSETIKKTMITGLAIKIVFIDKTVATFFKTEHEFLLEVIQELVNKNFQSLCIELKLII